MTLRIIGGEFRRRILKIPHGNTTRPYTDRIRQIVFDRIAPLVPNARVADIFSGVGTMGMESLSRGADSCVFIEGDAAIHKSLTENVATIAPGKPTVCWKTNIHRTSFCPQGADECFPYTLLFFDPPYDQCPLLASREVLGKALVRLPRPRATSDDATMILRTPEHFEFSGSDPWKIADCWRKSTMNLWVLKKRPVVDEPSTAEQHAATSPHNDDE